ncbi:hypothetical protein Pelo_885 [Pelomyxa schiedti]|nr:hypothetical protein Pelo_885 [Pelomyxa schiedti]
MSQSDDQLTKADAHARQLHRYHSAKHTHHSASPPPSSSSHLLPAGCSSPGFSSSPSIPIVSQPLFTPPLLPTAATTPPASSPVYISQNPRTPGSATSAAQHST